MSNKLQIQRFSELPPPPVRELNAGEGTKYLTDESRYQGTATALALPRSSEQVASVLAENRRTGTPTTVSAARTGITAGAVPQGGMVLNLEKMDSITGIVKDKDGVFCVQCQAGVTLRDLKKSVRSGTFAEAAHWSRESREHLEEIKQRRLFYPPDPTETTATIGGTVACDASGAHSFAYGATRPYVARIRVVLPDGNYIDLPRGTCFADRNGVFKLVAPDGTEQETKVPRYKQPPTKNAGGYYSGPGMDLIDLFIGSEGTLGVITEVDLRLTEAPEKSCAVVTFWQTEQQAVDFIEAIRRDRDHIGLEAAEFFGPNALSLLRRRREELGETSGVPESLPDHANAANYLDIGTTSADEYASLDAVAAKVHNFNGRAEHCWFAGTRADRERLRLFRHALPETVNDRIGTVQKRFPSLTKLGTDMAVPDEHLRDILRQYRRALDSTGLQYVIFGHIGDNHLHINILPQTPEEYELGKKIYWDFAHTVVNMNGSVAAEHGIGKLKKDFLRIMLGDEGIREIAAVKRVFDPAMLLGRQTLVSAE